MDELSFFLLYGILLALIVFKTFDAALNKFLLIFLAFTAGYSLLMGYCRAWKTNFC